MKKLPFIILIVITSCSEKITLSKKLDAFLFSEKSSTCSIITDNVNQTLNIDSTIIFKFKNAEINSKIHFVCFGDSTSITIQDSIYKSKDLLSVSHVIY